MNGIVYCVEQVFRVLATMKPVPALFCPVLRYSLVSLKDLIALLLGVQIFFQIGEPDQLQHIMGVTVHGCLFVREIIAACLFGDTGFQGTLDDVPAEIVCPGVIPRFQQRLRLLVALCRYHLEVFTIHASS